MIKNQNIFFFKIYFISSSFKLQTYAPKDGKMGIKADIHLWIGKTSSQVRRSRNSFLKNENQQQLKSLASWISHAVFNFQDEYASAAILMVELDDLLGGYPIQHRECQDHEGHKFKSYFKNGKHNLECKAKGALLKKSDGISLSI